MLSNARKFYAGKNFNQEILAAAEDLEKHFREALRAAKEGTLTLEAADDARGILPTKKPPSRKRKTKTFREGKRKSTRVRRE